MARTQEERLAALIASNFEGQGEAWSDTHSGDRLAAIAAQVAVRFFEQEQRITDGAIRGLRARGARV